MKYAIFTTGWKSLRNVQLCVEEAFASTLPPSEFCVVINPYGPETPQIIDYCIKEERITRYAIVSQNIGCARGFNIGFNLCESPYVVALSDDCRVGPETYEKMVREFEDPKVGIVGVQWGGHMEPWSFDVADVHRSYPPDQKPTIQGFLVAYRLKMINDLGGYNIVNNGPLGDECGLGLKAWANGWKSAVAEGCSWFHQHDISGNPDQEVPFMGRSINVSKSPELFESALEQAEKYNSMIECRSAIKEE